MSGVLGVVSVGDWLVFYFVGDFVVVCVVLLEVFVEVCDVFDYFVLIGEVYFLD